MDEAKALNTSKKATKKLTYRSPDKFRRNVFSQNPAVNCRVRSFGGHK